MNNSELFIKAHKLAKATIKTGDNYQHVFGACLKTLKTEQENLAQMILAGRFLVNFTKRTTGELRTMFAELNLDGRTAGGKAAYSFADKGLVPVFDLEKNGIRSIPLDAVQCVIPMIESEAA